MQFENNTALPLDDVKCQKSNAAFNLLDFLILQYTKKNYAGAVCSSVFSLMGRGYG